jgi:Sulfatase
MRVVRRRLVSILEFFSLAGVAIAVPVLDVFGRSPETFVRAGATRADLWTFAIVVGLGPPLAFAAGELLIGMLHDRTARRFHAVAATGLVIVALLPVFRDSLGARGVPLLVLASTVAVAAALAALRFAWIRSWVRFAAPLPLAAITMFMFVSPVADIASAEVAAPVEIEDSLEFDGPIVMLVFDEFPLSVLLDDTGTIDRHRYPNFARLADGSTWFRNATTVAARTEQAVPAMLTGRYPTDEIRAPDWSQYPDNLFRLLAGAYEMHVDEEITKLCPAEHCPDEPVVDDPPKATSSTTLSTVATTENEPPESAPASTAREPRGDLFGLARQVVRDRLALEPVDRVAETQVSESVTATNERTIDPAAIPATTSSTTPAITPGLNADGFARLMDLQPTRFVEFLANIAAATNDRSFHFLHVLLPHVPWHLTASGIPYEYSYERSLQFPGFYRGWSSQTAADAARVRVAMQIGYVDALIGSLIDQLEQNGLWDDAMVIVAADHGLGLHPGARMRYLGPESEDLLSVPLFVRIPGAVPDIDDRPAEIVDVLPTIADALGVSLPWPTDGVSLFGSARVAGTHPFASGTIGQAPTIDQVDVSQHLDAVLTDAAEHFRPTTNGHSRDRDFLDLGDGAEHIGRSIDVPQVRPIDAELDYPSAEKFGDVATDAPLPLHVVGHAPNGETGILIGVTINGTVAGVARTFADRDESARFTALLDPAFVDPGHNDIGFVVIDE